MNQLQPFTNPRGPFSPRPWTGKQLAPFTGKTLFSLAKHNEILQCVQALLNPFIVRTNRNAATITDRQAIYEVGPDTSGSSGGTPGSGPGSFMRYTIVGHGTIASGHGDYVLANPTANPSSGNVYILKPPLLRFSVLRRAAYAGLVYGNWDDQKQSRTVTSTGSVSTQYITPLYLPGDIIYVAKDDAGSLCDLNADGRAFAGPQ